MQKMKKLNKGISLMTLVIAVVIMLIITSVLVYSTNNSIKMKRLNDMYNDITLLQDKVSNYYTQYGKIPALKEIDITIPQASRNPNDNGQYYVIDLEAMENITLTYGQGFYESKSGGFNTDTYIINGQSHEIYYAKGINYEGTKYYTKPGNYTKVDVPAIVEGTTIPKGFYYVGGTKDSGLIISDSSEDANKGESWEVAKTLKGNQFVWIPVENIADFKTYEGYSNKALQGYLSNCTEPSTRGYANEIEEYNSMKASVVANKGFYIARYETGKENNKPVSKQGANVWTSIPWGTSMSDIGTTGAVYQSQNMYTNKNTYGVTSTLCYGVQWDAVMAFIDPAYKTGTCDVETSFVANSTGKGNYSGTIALAGSSSNYVQKNIYDLAGNVYEWTMEESSSKLDILRVGRGGSDSNGLDTPASNRINYTPDYAQNDRRIPSSTLFII